MIETAEIINPKRTKDIGFDSWYSYYAGYSSEFVQKILETSSLPKSAVILDPWNGSGTTTTVANRMGYATVGYDLNPVMAIAAKACLVNRHDYSCLEPLAKNIIDYAQKLKIPPDHHDPIATWIIPTRATQIRKLERAVYSLLINPDCYVSIANNVDTKMSTIAAFFYVTLFRTIRAFLHPFKASNPTWIKVPKTPHNRVRPEIGSIYSNFLNEVQTMIAAVNIEEIGVNGNTPYRIDVASSCLMPQPAESIDCIITSPPYCTRIDYAVATMPELSILGFQPRSSFDTLRRKLIGTSTVPKEVGPSNIGWGVTCNKFLELLQKHNSKASENYYYKSHLQYFESVYSSLTEVARILRPAATAVFVVQDSHYKEIHNNLPLIFTEMAENLGLTSVRTEHFSPLRNMAQRHPHVKKYRTNITANESVLCFKKAVT
ncbi:MAG: DNA methyltransferase [Bacteroidota bacterium]